MLHAAEPVPAEEEQADERGFEEERHQAFDRERRAEHVADVVRVVGPVRAELEFHRHAGGHAHREVDAEQHAPELGHAFPDVAPGHHVDRFHDREQPRQAERQRHEQEVIERGQRELQARKGDDIGIDHGVDRIPTSRCRRLAARRARASPRATYRRAAAARRRRNTAAISSTILASTITPSSTAEAQSAGAAEPGASIGSVGLHRQSIATRRLYAARHGACGAMPQSRWRTSACRRSQAAAANASRVRFSGAPSVQTTSSSMRMPPYWRKRSTLSQLTSLACGLPFNSASSMSMK